MKKSAKFVQKVHNKDAKRRNFKQVFATRKTCDEVFFEVYCWMYDWLHLFLDNMGNMGGGRGGGNMGYGGGYGGYGNNMSGNNMGMGGGPQNNNFSGYTSFGNENVSYPGNYNNMR